MKRDLLGVVGGLGILEDPLKMPPPQHDKKIEVRGEFPCGSLVVGTSLSDIGLR